jgi:hypothetical protein
MKNFTIFALLAFSISLFARERNLERNYVPIIIKGAQIPIDQLEIDAWSAYTYDSGQDTWTAIPFQVDEVYQGKYNKKETFNGLLDAQDELLVMPEDLGDRAPTTQWPNQIVVGDERIEINLSEQNDAAQQAWLYLFKSDQAPPQKSYMQHTGAPSSGSAADTVSSPAYRIGHNHDGWLTYLTFTEDSPDLVDRLKLRLQGNSGFPGIGSYTITEELLKAQNDPLTAHPGVLRTFRDVRTNIKLPFWPATVTGDYQIQYWPYSFNLGVLDAPINESIFALAGLKQLRQSLDLSPDAAGMRFYSAQNPQGFPIDGNPDLPDRTFSGYNPPFWVMASGQAGSVILILDAPQVSNAVYELYYYDNLNGGTLDNSKETGDGQSFGDMGLWLYTDQSGLRTNRLSMALALYMVPEANQNSALAEKIVTWHQTPVLVQTSVQQRDATGVARRDQGRYSQAIFPYPNPVQAGQTVTWELYNPLQNVELQIFNILGQRIFESQYTHTTAINWAAKGKNATALQPGLYMYRIFAQHNLISSGKLVIQR